MDQLAAHQGAQDLFANVLANVNPDQLDLPSPCTEWNAKGIIEHVIGGNQRVQQLAGRQPAALADNFEAAHAVAAQGAQAVFAAPDGLTRSFQLPFGPMPGAGFVGLRMSDVFTHAWDLAKATGQSADLDPELAREALEAARKFMRASLRGPGRPFGEERACPSGRPAADELAAFLGRAVD
jgi:uncharacterized protein (TIGR03086 family)